MDISARTIALLATMAIAAASFATAQEPLPRTVPEVLAETPAVTADDEPWLLIEVEAYAENVSPILREAAAEVDVQRGRAYQAGLYPNLVLEGGSQQWGGTQSQYQSTIMQEFVTKGKLKLDRAAIMREVAHAQLKFNRARFDLLTDVRQRFYATLTAQQRLEAIEELMKIVRRSMEAAQGLEKRGEVSRGDTLLVELEFERTDVALQNASVTLLANRRQLAATLGDPDLKIARLEGNLRQVLPDYPFELTQTGVLTRNALIQAAQVEIDRQRVLLQRAVVEPFPNITAQGGYLTEVQRPHDQAILSISMPLPIWNKNQGGIQSAQAGIGKATHSMRRTQVELIGELAAATGRFDVARQQVAKYEKSILPKARETVKIAQQGFDGGEFDLLRVLQSQRALIESQLNYLNAQESRWNAAAEIAGLLQEEEFPQRSEPKDRGR
jgi:cobalt-zinc-cadmium efflux system outer membrane protein